MFISCQGKAEYHILSSHLKRTTDLQLQGPNRVFDLKECIYVAGINIPHSRKSEDSFPLSKWQRTKTCLYSFPSPRVISAFFITLKGKQMIKRWMTSVPYISPSWYAKRLLNKAGQANYFFPNQSGYFNDVWHAWSISAIKIMSTLLSLWIIH